MRYRHPLVCAVGVMLCLAGVVAEAATGRTAGSFNVSSVGSATYSLPIAAPSGPRGLQPRLALVYNSRSGSGPLGVGWSLAGLSGITRCNRTFAQDAAASSVALTYADAFCLDGKRLRITSSSGLGGYGQDGTTYQTEIADFSNVTAHGVTGNGPAYFTVQGRDGLTYEYGNGGNSQIRATGSPTASAWLLNKVMDRANNSMVIAYLSPSSTLTGTSVPATISWTPTSAGASTYSYTMQLNYSASGPETSIVGYVAGTSVLNQNLLRDITITNATGATIRRYVLDYGTSPTSGRYELTQVKECADGASADCLLPTTITYQNGQAGVSASTSTAVSGASVVFSHYDFNGDGYPDLLYLSGSDYSVAFGSSGGYGAAVSTGIRSEMLGPIGDLLGTGTDGMVANNGGTWWYYTWNAGSNRFAGSSMSVAVSTPLYALVDTNGDGLLDLVGLQVTTVAGDYHTHLLTRLNTSSGGTLQFNSAVADSEIYDCNNCSVQLYFPDQAGAGPLRAWDFNGDGRQDLALRVQSIVNQQFTRRFYELLSNGTTFTASLIGGPTPNDPALPYVVNWNNDACSDALWNQRLYISGCNGAAATVLGVAGTFLSALDWNQDGRTDLLVANGGTIGVYLSTGTGVSALQTTSVPYAAACARTYFTADFDADGLDDLGCWSQTGSTPVFYHLHNAPGKTADLVASITDGYGVRVSPTYTTTSRGSYAKGQEATYPEENIHTPLNVVDQVSASDGIGGTFSQTFTYAGARRNVQGRGFEGFQSQTIRDSRANALLRVTTYQTAFPFTGMPIAIDTFQHDGATVVSHATYDNRKTDLDTMVGNQRAFVFTQSDTTQTYEVGGVKNGQLIHTAANTRTYDTVGNATRVQTTSTDNDTGSPYAGGQWSTIAATTYAPDAGSHWCLTQPTQSVVTRTAPGVAAISLTTQFTPDFANCRESQRVIEPGSATYSVAQSLSYDGFGNVSGTTISGVGMAPRTTTLNWGATGQFPISVANALSEVTQFGYDRDRGVRTSATEPSGITTLWQYDAFGRKTREIRPDGTATAWAYNDCAGTGGCLIGNHSLAVTTSVYNADGSLQTDGTAYFDPLDRPLVSNARMLASGAYSRNEVRYDNLGRVQQHAAPCAWAGLSVACPYWATSAYDALGRLTQTQRPISAANGALQTTRIQYAGRTTTTIDAQGKSATQLMTIGGSLARVQDHSGYSQSLSYDAFGSLLGVTDGFGNTLFTAAYDYGVRPFQRDATDADLDLSSAAGEHRHYTYNALGELTSWSDAKGQNFSQTYDALSRPLVRTEPDLATSWTWGTSAASHDIGQLRSVTAGSYSESFTFDSLARLSSRTITIPADGTYRYDFAYNAATGLLDTLTYPASTSSYRLKVQHRYQNGTLQSLSDFNAPGTVFWTVNATNPRGQVTQETLGNGAITNRVFDAVTGWAGALQTGRGGGAALQNESYLFDLAGNLTQRQNNNVGLTENFYYDDLYRLDHSMLGGAVNLAIAYDASGNIRSRSDVAGGASWTYDLSHRHAVTRAGNGNYTYAYDANGNARTRDGLAITWTSFNHPSAINGKNLYDGGNESVQFAYDQNHERWRTLYSGTGGAETTYLIGGLLEKVLRNGATDYRHYIQAGDSTIAIYSRTAAGTNTLRYIRGDHEGSLSGVLASDGASYLKTSFTAFGNRRSACSWSGRPTSQNLTLLDGVTRHGYTWQTALGAMGLNDMNGRIQDAVTGRFLSPDPYVSDPAFTQSYNRYSYVNNNPLTYTDPTGFAQTPAFLRPNDDPERSITIIGIRSDDSDFSWGNDFRNAIDRFLSGNSEEAALEKFFNYRVRPVSSRAPRNLPPPIEIGPSPTVPFVPHEPGLVSSFIGVDDLLGTLQAAILDGLGCDGPTCQLTASLLLAASNPAAARGGAAALADSALVCRGGTCIAKRFINGSGVSLDSAGRLLNVSVNSATGKALDDLATGIPNSRIGVTTVGSVRAAGGNVLPSPTALNPNHCVLCGITPEQAEALFTPSILNPNR